MFGVGYLCWDPSTMLDLASLLTLGAIGVALQALYMAVTWLWWSEESSRPTLHYQDGSEFSQEVVRRCSTLQER